MTKARQKTPEEAERVRLPEITSKGASSSKVPASKASQAFTASAVDAAQQRNLKKIKFFPCSPGQILQMAKLLGVQADKEFYLLPLVRKAVIAPFPQDWAVEVDKTGKTYYYNKYTHKVITVHPLSDVFVEWVDAARHQHEEELRLFRERLEADGLTEDAVENNLQGDVWMKFTTPQEDEEYWYNFQQNRLYSLNQYHHVLQLELEDRRTKATTKEDPKKMEKKSKELKLRQALGLFTGNIKLKYWLRWTTNILALRNAQAQALVKSGMVNGRQEAKGFRQWKEKIEQLAFVRKVMEPLGGRRKKAISRDIFNAWKDVVIEQIEDKKASLTLKDNFLSWKHICNKKRSFQRLKDIIRGMLQSGSLSVNFSEWAAVAKEKKDHEVEVMTKACIVIQRGFRERLKHKEALRALQNKRKQIKMQLLKLSDNMTSTVNLYTKDLMAPLSIFRDEPDEPPKSLAMCLLEGAMETAKTDVEKARLRQVLRNAKAKIVVSPDEEGFGTSSIRAAIGRVVDLLDPIDRVQLRARLDSLTQDQQARADAAVRGELQTLSDAVEGLLTNIAESKAGAAGAKLMLDPVEREALVAGEEGSKLANTAAAVKRVLDSALRPEARSKQVGEALVTDAVGMLDELDLVMDRFLTIVDSRRAAADVW